MKKKRKKKNRKPVIILSVILIVILCVMLVSYSLYKREMATDKIFKGVSVGGVDVSQLSKDEALTKVTERYTGDLNDKKINFVGHDTRYSISLKELGYTAQINEAVDKAYGVGRSGNIIENVSKIFSLPVDKEDITIVERFDDAHVERVINFLEEKTKQDSKDAYLSYADGEFQIVPEQTGTYLNKDKLKLNLYDTLRKNEDVILPVNVEKPTVTSKDFEGITGVVGEFTTDFSKSSSNRKQNIALASSRFNNFFVKPGEVVSFNDHIGDISKETGYMDAGVIINGQFDSGVGGGVCQVSTTVYNALLLADIKIKERANHSLPVAYVPMGTDAAVASGFIDLKFENSTNSNIYITCGVNNGRLTCRIFGNTAQKDYQVNIVPKQREVIEPNIKTVKSDEMFEGEEKIDKNGSNGFKYETYKQIIKNGKVVSETKISNSYYKPQDKVVIVGTKKPEIENPEENPLEETTKDTKSKGRE